MVGLIDIVVPAHNAGEYLPTFLASVRANAPQGCRYLVIDDSSTDDTCDQLLRAAESMPYLVVTSLDQPVGVAAARNIGLAQVRARYLAFVDVDDWMAPGRLAALIGAQQRTGAAMVRTDHVRVNGFRRVSEKAPAPVREVAFPAVDGIGDAGGRELVDYPFLWAGVFDTEQLQLDQLRFDEALRTASDRPWFWRLHLSGVTCAVVDCPAYFYRRSPVAGSLTEGAHARLLDVIPAMRRVLRVAATSGADAHRRRAAYTAVKMVALHLRRRSRLQADWQRELVLRAAGLMAEIQQPDFTAALLHTRPAEAELARRLREAGQRWSA